MRILQNMTKAELDFYSKQPTAKALHERIMKDAVYIPEGDRDAAAAYVARRSSERAENQRDKVEISPAGQKLSQAGQRGPGKSGGQEPQPQTPGGEQSLFCFLRQRGHAAAGHKAGLYRD